MRSLTKKKTKVWLITLGSVLLTTVLVLSGVGIYIKANSKPKGQPAIVNPLDFSVDAWDGKTVNGLEFNENYAGRGLKTKTIDSASSFVYFVNEVNAGKTFDGYTVYLNKSIDLSGYKINSIGSKENPFMGTFDGGYYTIMNATVNGDGLFGCTTNAEIKNVGLYNSTIKSDSEVVGGLIGTAINTNISNSFIRLKEISSKNNVGGLVGEFISNNGEHKIENSFVDTTINANNVGGLVYSLSTNNSSENSVRIENSYYTNGDKAVAVVDNADFLTEEKVIRPTSKNSFVTWDYESDYEKGKTWCDYSYLENSKKLDFNYPILSSFNKVYLTGSHYESVVVSNGEVKDISTLSDAFDEADKSSETKVNLLVEKIFMEARAEVENNVTVKVNAVKDTTIVRGEHNDDSMFVSTGSSKIVLGYDGSDDNISAMSSGSENENIATLTLDGNREEVEKNNQKSGALVVANGTEVEIHENVVLKNNVNNNVGYGGAVLVYGSPSMPIIAGDIENCFAEYGGGGICAVGTAPDTVGNINGCSSNGDGGGIALIEEFDQSSAVKAMSKLYGNAKNVVPTAVTNVTGKPTDCSGTSYSSNNAGGNGGAFSIGSSYGARFSASTITFSNCSAKNGGVIYAQGSIIFWDPTTVNFKNNYATANGGAIWSSCYQAVFNSVVYYGINNGNGSYDGGKFVFDVNHAGYNLDYDSTGSVGYGGAIYLSGQATLANYNTMEFKTGLADYGGAIYMASGSNILNSFTSFSPKMTFNKNMGEMYGGAIYGAGSVQLAGTNEFTDNKAKYHGGAVYSGTSASVSGTSTFTSNQAGYGESDNYDGGSRGGAIYATTSVGVSGTSTFKSNYAYGQGGAIWSDAVTVTGSSAGKILFQNNNAYSYGGKYDTCGAAIYSEGNLKISNTTFKYNRGYNKGTTYALKGGAIYNHSGSSTTLNKIEIGANTVFEHNFLYDRAAMGSADTQNSMGGAIYAYAATMTVNGAGIVFDGNGYDDTSAEPQNPHSGGGIYFGYGTLSITGTSSSKVQFNGNQTLTRGGAIWANNPVTIQYATFDSNKAGRYTGQVAFGGAIYTNSNITIKGGTTFSGNRAVTDSNQQAGGGAILMNTSTTLTVSGTNTFSGNYADSGSSTGLGGAIYFNTSAKATLGGTNTFSNNYTTSDSNDAFGGALYFNNSTTLTMSGTNTFNGNHAVSSGTKGHGGAIFFNTGTTATLSGTMNFTGNYGLGVTYSFGGAIYVHATQKSFSMTGTQTFEGNYVQVTTGSAHGGAIYAAGSAWTLNIGGSSNTSRAIFRNNYAKATSTTAGTAYAGAIGFNNSYTGDATTGIGLSVTNATFTNNYISAFGATQGGAIRNNGSNLYIGDNVTFTGNSTTTNSSSWTNGGAAYNGGAKTTTIGNNVVFENNTCSNTVDSLMSLGGGLCVESSDSKLKIANVSGVKFTGNTSAYGGAIFLRNAGEIGGSGDATSIVFENNTATYVGGAISAAGELEIFCATFKTNKVSASMANTWVGGGAIRMTGSVTLKIGANTIFDGNSVENKSTALYAFAGAILCETPTTLAVSGSNIVFQNNKASYGGAVMVFGAATFTGTSASKISFTGNEAVYGGAIRMQENNTGSISYATFNSNKATSETEWIWVAGGGIYLGSSRTLSLGVGVSFSNNTAKNEVSAGYGHGGAIYIESNSCAVNLASNTYSFTSNSADGTGGAIASHGTINSSDSVLTFTSNSARLGGAIYIEDTGNFNATRSSSSTNIDLTFNTNTSTYYGGAIYSEKDFTISSDMKAVFSGNKSGYDGGAIYVGQCIVTIGARADVDFTSNEAGWSGGAVFADRYVSTNADYFDGNKAKHDGGAIYIEGGQSDVNFKNMTFTGNIADCNGGAIYAGDYVGYIYLEGSTFTSNEADAGGAIYTTVGGIYTQTATFTGDIAYDHGGAIATGERGGVTVGASTFSSNQAQGDCGGAIHSSSVIISGVATFNGNTAGVDGGAILTNSINITANATFENNTAGSEGGAIYCGKGSITISCTTITFTGNKSAAAGGAISASNTDITITANYVNLNENTAGYNGGAISGYNSDITITANVGYLSNDNTAGTEGGAIYCESGSLIITARSRIEFQRNSAGSDGGAIYISGQTLSLYAGQSGSSSGEIRIIGNTSEGNGGAIYAHVPDGESSFTGYTLIESNEADGDGGAIYYDSSEANLYFNGGYDVEPAYINQNSARNGGAIYLCDGSISYRSVDEFLFENNTATQNGGAIYSDLDFTPYVNFALSGNSAQNGGAIFVSGSFDTTAYVGMVGNSASETGAGIYATDGVALNEAYFDNNIATGTLPAQIYAAAGITLNQDITIITANNSVADFCLGGLGHITFQTDPTNTYTVYKENITYYNGNSSSGSYIFSGYVTFDASVAGAETPVSVLNMPDSCVLNYNDVESSYGIIILTFDKPTLTSSKFQYDGTEKDVTNSLTMTLPSCVPAGSTLADFITISGNKATDVGSKTMKVTIRSYYRWNTEPTSGTVTKVWSIGYSELRLYDYEGTETQKVYPKYGTKEVYTYAGNAPFYVPKITSITIPTREGYTFLGWYDQISGGNKVLNADATIVAGKANYTNADGNWIVYTSTYEALYERWEAIPPEPWPEPSDGSPIIYKSIGDDVITNAKITGGSEYFTYSILTNEGDVFAISQNADHSQGMSLKLLMTSKVTKADTYSIKLRATDDNTGLYVDSPEYSYSVVYPKLNMKSDASTVKQTIYPKHGTTSVYADCFGVSTSSIQIPTREGYTFLGWYDAITGGKQVLNADGTLLASVSGWTSSGSWSLIRDNVDLYERWSANSIKVTFDANGSTVSTTERNVAFDDAYGSLPTPANKEGYTFAGWEGKNLIDLQNASGSTISVITTTQNSITAKMASSASNGTPGSGNWSSGWLQFGPFALKPNTDYTFSYDVTFLTNPVNGSLPVTHKWLSEQLYNQSARSEITISELNKAYRITKTFKTPTRLTDKVFITISLNSATVKLENVQLEVGNTATTYEPHLIPGTLLQNKNITFMSVATSDYQFLTLYDNVTAGKTYHVNIGDVKDFEGTATEFSVRFYNKTTGKDVLTQKDFPVGKNTSFTVTIPKTGISDDTDIVVYNGKSGSCTGHRMQYSDVRVYEVTNKLEDTSSVAIPCDHTLIAKWNPNIYTVTYNGNGADSQNKTVDYKEFGSEYGYTRNIYPVVQSYNFSALNPTISNDIFTVNKTNSGSSTLYLNFWTKPISNLKVGMTYTYVIEVLTWTGDSLVFQTGNTSTNAGNTSQLSVTYNTQVSKPGVYIMNKTYTGDATAAYLSRDFITLPAGKTAAGTFRIALFEGNIKAEEYSYVSPGSMLGYNLPTATRTGYNLVGWYSKNMLKLKDLTGTTTGLNHSISDQVYTKTSTMTVETTWLIQKTIFTELFGTMSLVPGTYTWKYHHVSGLEAKNPYIELTKASGETIKWYSGTSVTLTEDCTLTSFRHDTLKFDGVGTTQQFKIQLEQGSSVTAYEKSLGKVEADTLVSTAGNHTLYALWTRIEYTIEFLNQNSLESVTLQYGEEYTLTTANNFYTITYNDGYGNTYVDDSASAYIFDSWTANFTGGTYEILYEGEVYESGSIVSGKVFSGLAYGDTFVVKNLTTTDGATVTFTASYTIEYYSPYAPFERTGEHIAYWYWYDEDENYYDNSNSWYLYPDQDMELFAHWEYNKYYVSFKGNGSTSGSMSSKTYTYYTTYTLPANTFVKSYTLTYNYNYDDVANSTATVTHKFDSWNTAANGSGTRYTDKASVKNLTAKEYATVNLYAQWTAGSVTLPTPTRTGYTFKGWYDQAEGGNLVAAGGATHSISENTTLYAQWAEGNVSYKVNHYLENIDITETLTTSNSTLKASETLTGKTGATTQAVAHDYEGFTAQSFSQKTIAADSSTVIDIFYTRKQYTLTLSAGTGVKSVAGSGTYDYEKEVNISVTELQAGYDWDKWTITTGSAPLEFTETTQNQTIKIGGNVTLTATGKAKELIVTFDANGGSIADGDKTSTVSYGGTYETLPEPSRAGYTFAGWYGANLIPYPYSATSSSEYKVNNDGSIDVNLTTGENQYKGFIFHKNGTIPAGKYKYTNGGFADVQLVFLYKDANNANAWITVTDGKSLTFATDFNYVQFYVQVNPNKTVNGTIYPMFVGDIEPAETYEQFVGFGEIELTSTVTATTNHVLHAKWIANNYTVSFDGKNYIEYPLTFVNTNVSTSKQYVTYEGNEQILNVTFESTNGTNTGPFVYIDNLTIGETYYWTIDVKSTIAHKVDIGVEFRDFRKDQSLTTEWQTFSGEFTATKTRHALCIYKNFVVGEILSIKNLSVQHIDSVSFEQALGNRTVTYAAQYGTLPTPTRTGYKFDGWFTSSGTKVTADTVVSTLSNHTLTASWTEIDFDIDGDGDGSGGGSKDIIIAPGDTEILVATIKAEGGSGSFTYEIINANTSNFYLNTTGTTSVSTSESVNLYLTVPGVGDWTCQVKITDDHNKLTKTSKVYTVKIKYPTLILKDDNSTTQQTVYPRHNTTTLYTGPQSSSTTSLYTPTSISGHTFLGWYTALNGGKKVINANKTLVANVSGWTTSDSKWALTSSPKTLYERWELNTYTLTFEGNGHGYYMSGNSEYTWYNQSFLWGTSFSLTPNKFEGRTYPFIFNPIGCGYDFMGYTDPVKFKNWNTKADGTGTSYANGATITLYGDLTLYAQWESIYKTLEHPNSIAQNNSTFAGFIEQYQTGYTFIGWYTGWDPEDRGTFIGMPGDKWYIPTEYLGTPSEYIYAHWEPNKVNVTYDANGGGFNILTNGDFEHIKTNENIGWDNELNGTTIAASGWNSGFGNELSDRDKGYHAHLKTLEDGNTVLRFKTNEGISGVSSMRWLGMSQSMKTTLIAGHTYVLTMDVNRMSGTGYVVAGIYYKKTASDESAAFHSGRYNYKPTVNGEWQTISQTFTMADQYNNNGMLYIYGSYSTIGEYLVDNVVLVDITEGVSQTKLIQETYNSAYTLPIPYKEGSTFLGWTTSSTGGTPLEEGTIVTNANPHTLYAQWSTISPTLTLEFTLDGVVVDASTIGVSADFTIGSDPNKETFTARPSFSRAVDYGTKYQITKVNYISGQYRVTFNANEQTMLASNAKMIIQLETVYYTLKFVYFNGYDAPIHDTKLAFTAPGTTMVVTSSGGATRNDNQIGYGETITIKHPYSTEEITVSVATTNTERRYYIYNGDFGGYHGKPVNASITWTPTSNNTHANFTVIEYLNYSAQSGTGIVANGAKAKYQWTTQEGSYVAGTSSIYQGSQISFRVEDTDLMAGYEFDGWYEDKNGDGTFTINERVSVLKEFIYCEQGNPGGGGLRKDLTLTAVAKAKTITVTFDKVADDATLTGESTSDVAYGQTYGYLPKLTRAGYTFGGWYGKNLADASQFVVINGDGSVKYSYNSVTGVGTIYNSSTSGYGIALYSITLKPNTDYTISADLEWEIAKGSSWGWRIKKATTNTWVGFSNNDTFTFTTDEGGTVSIYFYIGTANANKGNVYISNIQLEEGKTRTSYEAYSSIGEVTAETTVTAIADHTLYAKWIVNTYTITYKENNTFSPMGQDKYQTVTYGQEFTTYSGSIFINPGFTIKGWCENASGSGTLIQTNTNYVYQKAGDMTLYAIWEANTYTVRFEGTNYAENIGHFGFNVATATKTTEYVGNEKVEHLTFKSVSGTNTGPYYKIHGLTVGETYYWSVDVKTTTPHTVNLGIEKRDWKTNQSLTTEWQTFSGKFTAVGANSEALCVYQNFTVGETLSIKNMSIQRCADVSFERALGNKTVTYTSQYGALPVPTRTGYNFTGWFTATSGGTEVTSGTIVTRAENHTLYAHWTPIKYTIVFEPYSCQEAADRESITVEAVYDQWVSLEEFTWTFYYTFYLDEGTVYHTEDVTFESYDYYDELGGLICDIYAGGLSNLTTVDGSIVHIYVALYEGMYLPYFEDPTREGYKFAGWYDQAEGGNLVFAPSSGYDGSNAVSVNNKYTSYYAHWTPIEYTIVFDYGDLYSDTVIEPITVKYNEVKKITESFDWTYNLVYYMNNGTDDIFTTQVLGFAHYGWEVDTFGGFYWTDYNKTPIEMNNEVYVEKYYIYNTSFYVKNLTTVDGATVTFTAFPMSEAYYPTYEIPEMTAKQFKHWSDSPNGSTNIYTSETYLSYSFFNRKTIEFYAIWEDAKYNIDVKYEVDGFKLYYDEELDYGDIWETNSRIYIWLTSQGYNYPDYNPSDPVDYIIAYALECLGLTTNVKAGSTTYQNPLTITGIVHGSEYQITSISRNADKYDVEYDGEKHNITSNTELLIVFTTRTYTTTIMYYTHYDESIHATDLTLEVTGGTLSKTTLKYGETATWSAPYGTTSFRVTAKVTNGEMFDYYVSAGLSGKYVRDSIDSSYHDWTPNTELSIDFTVIEKFTYDAESGTGIVADSAMSTHSWNSTVNAYTTEPRTTFQGAGVSFKATTQVGYTFDGWYDENGNKVTMLSTTATENADGTITYESVYCKKGNPGGGGLREDLKLTAQATINSYSVLIKTANADYGMIWNEGDLMDFESVSCTWEHGALLVIYDQFLGDEGSLLYLLANPKPSDAQYTYIFDGWYIDNVQVTEGFAVTSSLTIEARFSRTINIYTVSFASSNTDYGTVDLDKFENVPYGTAITVSGNTITVAGFGTVTASPVESDQYTYEFTGWTGVVDSVNGNIEILANFKGNLNQYTVTVVANDEEYGSVNSTKPLPLVLDHGTQITVSGNTITVGNNVATITAVYTTSGAQYTYGFMGWNGVVTVTTNSATIIVTKDMNIFAVFTQTLNAYDVEFNIKSVDGKGDVVEGASYGYFGNKDLTTLTYKNIDYGTVITESGYSIKLGENTTVSLSMLEDTAQYTYTFLGWSGVEEFVNGKINITATVQRTTNTYNVQIVSNPAGYGTVSTSNKTVEYGTPISVSGKVLTLGDLDITATETDTSVDDDGYEYSFVNWTGVPQSGIVEGITTVYANFTRKLKNYKLTYYGVDGATFAKANPTTYTYETATFTLENPTMAGYTFAGWVEENVNNEPSKAMQVAYHSMGDKAFTAVWLVDITIEQTGANGNDYKVIVNDLSSDVEHKTSFQLTKGSNYSIYIDTDLIYDYNKNNHQIVRISVNGEEFVTAATPANTHINRIPVFNGTISEGIAIKFEFFDAYMLTVNPISEITGISVETSNVGNNLIIPYSTENAYIVSKGTDVVFSVDSTPVTTAELHTFIGFEYVANNTTHTIGVNGSSAISLTDFEHNANYQNDSDIGTYTYFIDADANVTSITVQAIVSQKVSINTAPITGTITLTSVHGFNKVIDADTSTVILYNGVWTVTRTDLTLNQLKDIFDKYLVEEKNGVITVTVATITTGNVTIVS